jgi:purine-binding chemotaxis protein CheW
VASGDELQFIVFRIDTLQLALSIFQVARILRYAPPAVLDDAPPFIEGGVAYLGSTVPLLDLRKRLGFPAESHEETRIMVLEHDARRLALVVDQVHEALRVDTRTITLPAPPTAGLPSECLSGVIARAGRTILVVNPGRLLTASEQQALAELCA